MVIRVDVVEAALRERWGADPVEGRGARRVVALAASGRRFDDALASELAGADDLTLLCGRYEGFDERVHEHLATDVVSIGPYVLAGGELAAMVVCGRRPAKAPGRARSRGQRGRGVLQPGAGGRARVPALHPPGRVARARSVPDVLLSGDHGRVREWRLEQSRRRAGAARTAGCLGRGPPSARYHSPPRAAGSPGRSRPLRIMSGVIDSIERAQLRRVPVFQAGDRVRVHFQVVEGTRRRTQVFEGVVIKRQGTGARETFTVRKQSFGVGVERTFPVHSPKIERIEVAGRGDVRRAKLYYLRDRVGRGARVRERRFGGREEALVEARRRARARCRRRRPTRPRSAGRGRSARRGRRGGGRARPRPRGGRGARPPAEEAAATPEEPRRPRSLPPRSAAAEDAPPPRRHEPAEDPESDERSGA